MSFIERIKRARLDAGLTQQQVSDRFNKCGYSVMAYAISSWETGKHKPDLEQFAVLCDIYTADAGYLLTGKTSSAQPLLFGLNKRGREHAVNYINLLKSESVFTDNEPSDGYRQLRLYGIPVSAGTGIYLEGDDYELITVPSKVSEGADYAVRVAGDSMEPRFFDGDILFVRKQDKVDEGEIGIFSLNGESYVKLFNNRSLVSLNGRYSPIGIKAEDDFCVLGRVIGNYRL